MPQNVKTPQVLQDSPNVPESVQKGTNLILAKAATCGHLLWRPLAATCGHSSGCKWLQVVADEKRMRAATGGHSIGCKWLQVAAAEKRMLAATGGHLRPLYWQQVAASGCR